MEQLGSRTLVDGLVRMGEALASDYPISTQMETLCEELTKALGCDRSSIMVWDGRYYRGKYNFGHPPDLARVFPSFRAGPDSRLVLEMIKAGPYLVMNDAESLEGIAGIAKHARVNAAVVAPITHPDGSPLAFITAEFSENFGQFDDIRGRAVLGAARLAQRALIADQQRQARRRDVVSRRELLSNLTRSEESERSRLSREIHDDSMQRVLALRLKLSALAEQAQDPVTRDSLANLAQMGAKTTNSLRDLLQNLHPRGLDNDGLATALSEALERSSVGTGWTFNVVNDLEIEPPGEIEIVLYRSALHVLTNIEIYSAATEVTIDLATADRGTRLILTENGGGLDASIIDEAFGAGSTNTTGMSLRQRIEHTGGTIELTGAAEPASSVTIWIPNQLKQGQMDLSSAPSATSG